ncbi:MAG: protein kinase domain-containing protein, partial [Actinomycetota bacterium]
MIGDGYPSVGERFAGHRIDSIIGRGSTGVVFAAEHLESHRRAALRILRPDLAHTIGFPDRFLAEVRNVGELGHPNSPGLLDAGRHEDLLFVSMELADGWDLQRLVDRQGRLHPRRVASLVGQVGGMLDAAHARGVVHGRLGPADVLVAPSGRLVLPERVVVTGFGLGSLPADRTGPDTAFLAPEVLESWAPG